jgi:hypothetical protein
MPYNNIMNTHKNIVKSWLAFVWTPKGASLPNRELENNDAKYE